LPIPVDGNSKEYLMIVDNSHVFLQFSELGVHLKSESSQEFELISWDKIKKKELALMSKLKIERHQVDHLTIEILHSDFLLIPQEYDTKLYRIGFLEKALGQEALNGKEIHDQPVQWIESNLAFLIPSDWKDFASSLFPLAKVHYRHILGELLAEKSQVKSKNSTQLHLYIQGKFAFMSLFYQGKLQLANVFVHQSTLELAFYLHSIRDSFDILLTRDTVNIHSSGAESDATIQSLAQYNILI
jgi:hypothetical protein